MFVVSGTNVDTDEDIADPMLNHDNKSKELIASLVVTFNSSANGGLGTVAGTVMNTVIYNSGEAAVVVKYSTVYFDVMSEESTCHALGFDRLGGGTTTG